VTFAPQMLKDLATYWSYHGGVNLGIVGDTAHLTKGTSYHLGADDLIAGAYSATLPRDKAGLSNAASAIDLGKLNGTLRGLQDFSVWLVAATRSEPTKYRDVREIIYSPDGKVVKRWDNNLMALRDGGDGTGQGDNSHLTHTHISWFRDSEARDKRSLFSPFFDTTPPDSSTGGDVTPAPITDQTPKMVTANAGHTWRDLDGTTVLATNRPALVSRLSPYGLAGGLRAIYSTLAGHPIVIIDPATVDDVPVAQPNCDKAIADATLAGQRAEWDRQKVGATVNLLARP
jgi:hypothetical protein